MKPSAFLFAFSLAIFSSNAFSDAYKCKVGGKSVFQSEPCASSQETVRAVHDYVSPEASKRNQQQWENMRSELNQRDQAKNQSRLGGQGSNRNNRKPSRQETDSQEQYFMTGGGTMQKPPASAFIYDNQGNAYHKPPGSAFSTGPNGRTCFHFGAFADCH
jgi:hypothetical protein